MISIHEKNMHLITSVSSVSIVWPLILKKSITIVYSYTSMQVYYTQPTY